MEEQTKALEKFLDQFGDVLLDYAVNTLSAVLILIIGFWIAGRLAALTRRGMERTRHIDATLKPLVPSLVRYAVLVITLVAVLGRFGVETASIIAVMAAAGLAVGLALQGTLQNIASGIMLLILRPLRVGEYIEGADVAGTVDEIGLFTTQLTTVEGVYISTPNANLWGTSIINYSRHPRRRLDLSVGIAYGDDMAAARTALDALMRAEPRILDDPEPQTMVTALGDNSVEIALRCWARNDDFWQLKWDMIQAVKTAVEAAGCSIPFPQRDVHLIPAPNGTTPADSRPTDGG